MYAYYISALYISMYISNYISKHISKDKDNKTARRFCAVLAVPIYINVAILPPALPRALFLYIAPLLVLLAVLSLLFLYIQRITDKARRVSLAVLRLVAFLPVSAFLSLLVGRHIHPTPPPKPAREIWAAFPKNFFEILFFYFSVCLLLAFFV